MSGELGPEERIMLARTARAARELVVAFIANDAAGQLLTGRVR